MCFRSLLNSRLKRLAIQQSSGTTRTYCKDVLDCGVCFSFSKQTDQDEDLMRVCSTLAMRRGGADNVATTAQQLLDKYRVMLAEQV